jgi:hypothetical protein
MGKRKGIYGVWMRKPEGNDHLEGSCVDGKIILRWIFRKWGVEVLTGWVWLRTGACGGHL